MLLEGKNLEFKREYTDDIKYTAVAFANTDGGKIYIGINNDGSIYGVQNADDTILRVSNMIRDVVRPDITMFIDYAVEEMDNRQVVVVTVQRGTARPYYLHSKGVRPEGVYIRHGASSVPAAESAILNMIKQTSGDCYEDARSLNQQLTFGTAEAFFEKRKVSFGDQEKRTLNIIGADGTYTNLGLLLSDQCVHTIKAAQFNGSKKSVFHTRKELSDSLLQQIEDAYSFIDQINHTHSEFEGLYRIDIRDYPEEALREALLNAVVHRDYSFSGSILISIFDDRIEFVSTGGLVRGLSFDDIMLGISVLRNQHLANVFYRLELIEAYGTGILKINESYADCDKKPRFEVTDNAFKITLPNMNYSGKDKTGSHVTISAPSSKEERENIIVSLFEKQDTISRKDIENELKVSQATAILILRGMVDKGILIKEGNGKQIHYRLAE